MFVRRLDWMEMIFRLERPSRFFISVILFFPNQSCSRAGRHWMFSISFDVLDGCDFRTEYTYSDSVCS